MRGRPITDFGGDAESFGRLRAGSASPLGEGEETGRPRGEDPSPISGGDAGICLSPRRG